MARGKKAWGICDRTGFRYPLKDLVAEYVDGRPTGLLVGKDMVDEDHPQLRLSDIDASDDESLDDPRPDRTARGPRLLHPRRHGHGQWHRLEGPL